MPLGLQDVSKESEAVGLDSFVALFVEVEQGLVAGSPGLFLDDGIVFFSDFEDGADDVLVDHGVDAIVNAVHQFVQGFILGHGDLFLQFFVFLDHSLLHRLFFLRLVPECVLIEKL